MKNIHLLPVLALTTAAFFTGCGTDAHYIATGGRESVVSTGEINIQDYLQAAEACTKDLLASGTLDRVPNPPAVIGIGRIINNTSQQIDTDLLTKKIRVAVLQSGKAVTSTTYGLGGQSEDPLARQMQQQGNSAPRLPDFSLSGKIIQTVARAGDTHQSTYSFQLSMTDRQGLAVWESEKEITKQGTRGSVGF
jgi:uncharacterized protein (TIGR02722 family)